MACYSVTFSETGPKVSVEFSQVCGGSIGEDYLFDANDDRLLTADDEYITVNP